VTRRAAGGIIAAKQLEAETNRPERLPLERFAFLNTYGG